MSLVKDNLIQAPKWRFFTQGQFRKRPLPGHLDQRPFNCKEMSFLQITEIFKVGTQNETLEIICSV